MMDNTTNIKKLAKLADFKVKYKHLHIPNPNKSTLIKYGQQYLDMGWLNDAMGFFGKAGHKEGLEEISRIAMESGDAFLFKATLRYLGREGSREEWTALRDKARSMGKTLSAEEAAASTPR